MHACTETRGLPSASTHAPPSALNDRGVATYGYIPALPGLPISCRIRNLDFQVTSPQRPQTTIRVRVGTAPAGPPASLMSCSAAGAIHSGCLKQVSVVRRYTLSPWVPPPLTCLKRSIGAIKIQPKEGEQTLELGHAKQDNEVLDSGKNPTAGRQHPSPSLETNPPSKPWFPQPHEVLARQ